MNFAEQEIVIWKSNDDKKHVHIKIGVPRIEKDRDGDDYWACDLKLDGLVELDNPAGGLSSFESLVNALDGAKKIIREESKGAKIYLVDRLREKGELYPECGVGVKELFGG